MLTSGSLKALAAVKAYLEHLLLKYTGGEASTFPTRRLVMSFVPIGACPQCGAPVMAPAAWYAVTAPPVRYTCLCYALYYGSMRRSTSATTQLATQIREAKRKKVAK